MYQSNFLEKKQKTNAGKEKSLIVYRLINKILKDRFSREERKVKDLIERVIKEEY